MVAPAVPPEVHTEGVVVVKLTASLDEAVALAVTGDSARVLLASAPKEMVWDAWNTLKLCSTGTTRS
jgi:hypothetical protein